MAATYEAIQTYTLASTASSQSFTSIPSTYTDLVIVVNGAADGNCIAAVRFNSDTGTNYSMTYLEGDGTSAVSGRETNMTYSKILYNAYFTSTTRTTSIIQIQNYSNSTTYKTLLTRTSNTERATDTLVGLWRNTAAITNVEVFKAVGGGNFVSGTTFTLYGVKSA